jgi:hypothetical protein
MTGAARPITGPSNEAELASPRRPLPLHPLLLAGLPVLILYANNLKYGVSIHDLLGPLGVVLAGAAVVTSAAWLFLRRDLLRGALAASVVVVLFFAYGPFAGTVAGHSLDGFELGRSGFVLALWFCLAVAGVAAVIRLRDRRVIGVTKVLNLVAAGLLLANVARAGIYSLGTSHDVNVTGDVLSLGGRSDPAGGATATGRSPDIYYIMLDEYGGLRTLKDLFDYDNQPFLDFLRSRGFYVVDHARTNYPHTAHSLASSLNLQYIDQLIPPAPSDDWSPLYELIKNDQVPKFLKARGYRYIHMGSWWTPTASNPQADANIKLRGALSEFNTSLVKGTVLGPIGGAFSGALDFRKREYIRVLFEFDQLLKTRQVAGPKFVFAHILIPHEPFIFGMDGHYVDDAERAKHTDAENYVNQLAYANQRAMEVIDALLSGPSEDSPVIVLQSDEGPYTGLDYGAGATIEDLEMHFGILNAYHFPGLASTGLYPEITPVNTFRLLFDDYFDADLPLLPDRNYVFIDPGHLYTFIDVTDDVLGVS